MHSIPALAASRGALSGQMRSIDQTLFDAQNGLLRPPLRAKLPLSRKILDDGMFSTDDLYRPSLPFRACVRSQPAPLPSGAGASHRLGRRSVDASIRDALPKVTTSNTADFAAAPRSPLAALVPPPSETSSVSPYLTVTPRVHPLLPSRRVPLRLEPALSPLASCAALQHSSRRCLPDKAPSAPGLFACGGSSVASPQVPSMPTATWASVRPPGPARPVNSTGPARPSGGGSIVMPGEPHDFTPWSKRNSSALALLP